MSNRARYFHLSSEQLWRLNIEVDESNEIEVARAARKYGLKKSELIQAWSRWLWGRHKRARVSTSAVTLRPSQRTGTPTVGYVEMKLNGAGGAGVGGYA